MPAPTKNQPTRGEIVKPSNTSLAAQEQVPEYLRGLAREGQEEMDRSDFTLPRIAIAQTLSPALKKNKPQYIPDLVVGQMYNTVTKEIYGEEITFVAVMFAKARIYFEDINKGGGILCQSQNGVNGGHLSPASCDACSKSQFLDGNTPECNKFMNYPGFVLDPKTKAIRSMAAVSLKSTGVKIAKQWNSVIRMSNLPTYGITYKISVIEDSANGNDFWNYKIDRIGFTPETLIVQCQNLYQSLKAQGVKVDLEDADERADFNTSEM
jgi:hypothetical protein